ncbi:hypothetical protein [Arachidicoccus sp.]|uniref:hypothetical protein n=1 Tax=Arachidicoccus sp. TaxID=1872624 RepID=UPI003D2147F1
MKKVFTFSFLLVCTFIAHAQKIPFSRQYSHEQVDRAQLSICGLDGTKDGNFTPYADNAALNKVANNAINKQVDHLQKEIENKDLNNNDKIKYLRGLYELLYAYRNYFIGQQISGAQLVNVLKGYQEAMDLEIKGQDITPVIVKYKYEVAALLTMNMAFKDNPGKSGFSNILINKEIALHPTIALEILDKNPGFPATDSVIKAVALDSADALYNYASSYTQLGERIRKSKDPLVSIIARIASSRSSDGSFSGRQYMPFLDAIYHGSLTMDEVGDAIADPVKYFKLLVKTEINYAGRALHQDTAMAWQTIINKIHVEGVDNFINKVNGLHEKTNDIRYACLKPLSALDLYYLVVSSEEEIYTSSYINGKDYGLYNLLWQKGGKDMTGDGLLMAVNFDHFRKWIKMAANYNTLDNFLGRMNPNNAQLLMKAFVRGLDKGKGANDLEDAVDVAGSYSSLNNPQIQKLVLDEVQNNLELAKQTHNEKAYNIYDILNTLFLSMDPANNIDVSAKLGIEPVYFMPINNLKDSSGRIIIQQFTYGDPDGLMNYNMFMNAFNIKGWKTTSNQYWSQVSSTTGTPITIYTNKPLDELKALDDEAQQKLDSYLKDNNLHPTLVFHRGHSYYLPTTIEQLVPSARVVLLGSCGGFQSLNKVLEKAPEAQIISSKQTGVGDLNTPVIVGIVKTLQKGDNLNWVKMWKDFSAQLHGDARFADYVPPYQNLSAVFIMAYQKLQQKEKEKADSIDVSNATSKN